MKSRRLISKYQRGKHRSLIYEADDYSRVIGSGNVPEADVAYDMTSSLLQSDFMG